METQTIGRAGSEVTFDAPVQEALANSPILTTHVGWQGAAMRPGAWECWLHLSAACALDGKELKLEVGELSRITANRQLLVLQELHSQLGDLLDSFA
jgi:hypothetical protein